MLDPRQDSVYRGWCRVAAARGAVPLRSSFDPIDYAPALSTLILAERVADDALCFRLVGTDMVSAWGADFTGRHLHEIMNGEYHAFIRGLFDECIARETPLFSHSRFQWDRGRTLDTRRLMLPYARDSTPDEIGFVLVSQVFNYGKTGPQQPIIGAGQDFELIEIKREPLSTSG